MTQLFTLLPPQWISRYNRQDKIVELKNKSALWLGHFKELGPIKSLNLGFAGADQIEEMDLDVWDEFSLMRTRMKYRMTGGELPYRSCFGVGNLAGPAHWSYMWKGNELVKGTPEYDPNYEFIHVTSYDNAEHLPEDFFKNAEKRWGKGSRKWRIEIEGSGEALEGQVFWEFDHAKHVCRDEQGNPKDEIPKPHWERLVGIDYGQMAGHAALFMAIDDDKNLLIYDEAYIEDALVDDHVALIDQKLLEHALESEKAWHNSTPNEPGEWICDPSMRRKSDAKSRDDEAITIVGLYEEAFQILGRDVGLTPGSNDVDAGIDRVNFIFRYDRARVNPRCKNAIGQWMSYVYDQKTRKPKNGQKDHCCDTLRYICSRVWDLIVLEKEPVQETLVDRTIRQWKENKGSPFDLMGDL